MAWSIIFLLVVLTVLRKWQWIVPVLRDKRLLARFAASAVLLSTNWGIYIWAVNAGCIVELRFDLGIERHVDGCERFIELIGSARADDRRRHRRIRQRTHASDVLANRAPGRLDDRLDLLDAVKLALVPVALRVHRAGLADGLVKASCGWLRVVLVLAVSKPPASGL